MIPVNQANQDWGSPGRPIDFLKKRRASLTNFCAHARPTTGELVEIGHFSSALVGQTVRIRSLNVLGSARMLEGVRAKITGVHPIARGWYTLELLENSISPYKQWTAPIEQLVLCND